jgi:hypothetical protein
MFKLLVSTRASFGEWIHVHTDFNSQKLVSVYDIRITERTNRNAQSVT